MPPRPRPRGRPPRQAARTPPAMQAMGRELERAQQEAQAGFSPDPEDDSTYEEADPPPIQHQDDDEEEEAEAPQGPPIFALSPALA